MPKPIIYAIILSLISLGLGVGLVLGQFLFPSPPTPLLNSTSPLPSPSPPPQTTILIVGDVMLGRSVNLGSIKRQDFTWPFQLVGDRLRQADLTLGNLESPFAADCPLLDSGFKFCADAQAISGLTFAGFDVLSLANNHATNFGQEGIDFTKQLLTEAGISVIGLNDPAIIEKNGLKFGFLSYNDLDNLNKDQLIQDLQVLEPMVNLTLIMFHWGSEYVETANSRQVELAHIAIDNGADFVVGAHPHWIQNSEQYRGKTIYYSLGNFVFDQEWSSETKRGLAILLTYEATTLLSVDELPVTIKDYGQPSW